MKDLNNLKKYNAEVVLKEVNILIEEYAERAEKTWGTFGKTLGYAMKDVYDRLSIFDWWVNYLSLTRLKDMKKFLETAIELGYTGYVCFKVGAKGCSNGMWAHKEESTDGYSPNGDFIYKSFTPAYNYWNIKKDNKMYPETKEFDSIKTIKDVKELVKKL